MDKKFRHIWWVFLGILFMIAVLKFVLPVKSIDNVGKMTKDGEIQAQREIVVYITGAVENKGLIHLPLDARLHDALEKAQLRPDADIEALNPAQKLKDGQKIIIPKKISLEEQEVLSQHSTQDASEITSSYLENTGDKAIHRININIAKTSELDAIPGIGPALAQRIVDYRMENGLFLSTEEIQNVSGIGPKTYEKMELYITVGP